MKQLRVPFGMFVPVQEKPSVPRRPPRSAIPFSPADFELPGDVVLQITFPDSSVYLYQFATIAEAAQAFENLVASATFRNSPWSAGEYFNGFIRSNGTLLVQRLS